MVQGEEVRWKTSAARPKLKPLPRSLTVLNQQCGVMTHDRVLVAESGGGGLRTVVALRSAMQGACTPT